MKANPDKFQAICIWNNTNSQNLFCNVDSITIFSKDTAKLLGVTLDFIFKINHHASF